MISWGRVREVNEWGAAQQGANLLGRVRRAEWNATEWGYMASISPNRPTKACASRADRDGVSGKTGRQF